MTLADAFSRSAPRYDLLTALNPGYHRELRDAAQDLAAVVTGIGDDEGSGRGPLLWDLGCGSGLSTRALLAAVPGTRVIGLDASAGMLAEARAKTWPDGVRFVEGDAGALADQATCPAVLTEDPDGVLAAYLFRNLPPELRDPTLRALRERLRPGGRLVVHEYALAPGRRPRAVWTAICRLLVIPLARLVGADPALYRYLWRSVLGNDAPPRFVRRLEEAGFADVHVRSARGWHRGILHTYVATVPEVSP